MTEAPGLQAIRTEMARQHTDAQASFAAAAAMATTLATSLRRTGRLVLLGMGGSHWVNRTVVPAYRACGLDASAEVLSEALASPSPGQPRTVLIVSQSGASGEVLRYLGTPAGTEERFGLTLDPESPLGNALPCLVGVGGPERAFAATRSLLVSHALHLVVLGALGATDGDAVAALATGEIPEIDVAVSALHPCASFVLSGRGALAGVAESGALCLMELARCPALGFEAGQLRHGPMEMLSERTGVVILRGTGPTAELDAALARDCRAAGCPVVVLDASGVAPVPTTVTLPLPRRSGYAAALASLPTLQRLLVQVAAAKVADVGTPVRSSKVTTTPMTPPLVVIGNVNVDLMMGPQAPWPAPGTESILARSELRVGGAAGNTALAWQGLGAAFHIVANTSVDPLGCWLREPFGAASAAWPASTRPCAVSVGLTHPDGERTFFTTLGHLEDLGIDDVLAQLPPATEHGGLALLTGSFVTPRLLPDYETLMAALGAAGYAVALDTGWPNEGWSVAVRSRVMSWLPSCAHLLVNEAEALGMTGIPLIESAASLLTERLGPSATLVIKAGANGAYARAGSETVRVPAPVVSVIDTIGAGDTFNAGYLLTLQQGGSWRDAVNQGVTTATQAVATSPRQYRSI